jgi:hypothetical protein
MPRLVPDQRRRRALEARAAEAPVRAELNAAEQPTPQQRLEDYLERVSKYIPVEIVAAFITVRGLVPSSVAENGTPASNAWPPALEIALYAAMVALTPLYLLRFGGAVPGKARQVAVATISFVVWTYGIGGPFFWGALGHALHVHIVYQGFAGALVVVWSLAIGLMKPSS